MSNSISINPSIISPLVTATIQSSQKDSLIVPSQYIHILNKKQSSRLEDILNKKIIVQPHFRKNESIPDKIYPIEFCLRELLTFISETLLKEEIIKDDPYIVGSTASHILSDTPHKDIDVGFYFTSYLETCRNDFIFVQKLIINFLIIKLKATGFLQSEESKKNNIEQYIIDHYFKKRKLEISKDDPIKNFSIYGLGDNLDLKFCHHSKLLRRTTAASEGFHVSTKNNTAHCVHLGEIISEDCFLKALFNLHNRLFVVDKPHEIQDLIYRLSLMSTKAYEIHPKGIFLEAFELMNTKDKYTPAKFAERFLRTQESHYDRENDVGRTLNFLNYLPMLTYCYNISSATRQKAESFVAALAKTWKIRGKAASNFAALLEKYPQDARELLTLAQGLFFYRWIVGDSHLKAYSIDAFSKEQNILRMHIQVDHSHGMQYLALTGAGNEIKPPHVLALDFIQCLQTLEKKYEDPQDSKLFHSLLNDLGLSSQEQFSTDEIIEDIIQKFPSSRAAGILSEQFNGQTSAAFYEPLKKYFIGTSLEWKIERAILFHKLDKCNASQEKKLGKLIEKCKTIFCEAPTKEHIIQLKELISTFQKETKQSISENTLFKEALGEIIIFLCERMNLNDPNNLTSLLPLLHQAYKAGLITQTRAQSLAEHCILASQKHISKDFPELVAMVLQLLSSPILKSPSEEFRKVIYPTLKEVILPVATTWIKVKQNNALTLAASYHCLAWGMENQSSGEWKDLCLQFIENVSQTKNTLWIKHGAMAAAILLKQSIKLTGREIEKINILLLNGMSSTFSIKEDAQKHYAFFVGQFSKLQGNAKNGSIELSKIKAMDFTRNHSERMKVYLIALMEINFPLAVDLYHEAAQDILAGKDDANILATMIEKRIKEDDNGSLDSAFMVWNQIRLSNNSIDGEVQNKQILNSLSLISEFSTKYPEISANRILILINYVKNLLRQNESRTKEITDKEDLNQALFTAINSLKNLHPSISKIYIQTLTLSGRGVLHSQQIDELLFYLTTDISDIASLDFCDFFLQHFFSPGLLKHTNKGKIATAANNLIQTLIKGNAEAYNKALEISLEALSSPLVPMHWNIIQEAILQLFEKIPLALRTPHRKDEFNKIIEQIISKECLGKSQPDFQSRFFNAVLASGREAIYRPVWSQLINLKSFDYQQSCMRLTKMNGVNVIDLLMDAYLINKDPMIALDITALATKTNNVSCYKFIRDHLFPKLLSAPTKDESKLLKNIFIYLITFCNKAEDPAQNLIFIEEQLQLYKKTFDSKTQLEIESCLIKVLLTSNSVEFLVKAFHLIDQMPLKNQPLVNTLFSQLAALPAQKYSAFLKNETIQPHEQKLRIGIIIELLKSENHVKFYEACTLAENLTFLPMKLYLRIMTSMDNFPNSAAAIIAFNRLSQNSLPQILGVSKKSEIKKFLDALANWQNNAHSNFIKTTYKVFSIYLQVEVQQGNVHPTSANAAFGSEAFTKEKLNLVQKQIRLLKKEDLDAFVKITKEALGNTFWNEFSKKEGERINANTKELFALSLNQEPLLRKKFTEVESNLAVTSIFAPPTGRLQITTLTKCIASSTNLKWINALETLLHEADECGLYSNRDVKLVSAEEIASVRQQRIDHEKTLIKLICMSTMEDGDLQAFNRLKVLQDLVDINSPKEWASFLSIIVEVHDRVFYQYLLSDNTTSYIKINEFFLSIFSKWKETNSKSDVFSNELHKTINDMITTLKCLLLIGTIFNASSIKEARRIYKSCSLKFDASGKCAQLFSHKNVKKRFSEDLTAMELSLTETDKILVKFESLAKTIGIFQVKREKYEFSFENINVFYGLLIEMCENNFYDATEIERSALDLAGIANKLNKLDHSIGKKIVPLTYTLYNEVIASISKFTDQKVIYKKNIDGERERIIVKKSETSKTNQAFYIPDTAKALEDLKKQLEIRIGILKQNGIEVRINDPQINVKKTMDILKNLGGLNHLINSYEYRLQEDLKLKETMELLKTKLNKIITELKKTGVRVEIKKELKSIEDYITILKDLNCFYEISSLDKDLYCLKHLYPTYNIDANNASDTIFSTKTAAASEVIATKDKTIATNNAKTISLKNVVADGNNYIINFNKTDNIIELLQNTITQRIRSLADDGIIIETTNSGSISDLCRTLFYLNFFRPLQGPEQLLGGKGMQYNKTNKEIKKELEKMLSLLMNGLQECGGIKVTVNRRCERIEDFLYVMNSFYYNVRADEEKNKRSYQISLTIPLNTILATIPND